MPSVLRSSYTASLPTTSLPSGTELVELGDLGRWCRFSFDSISIDQLPPAAGIREDVLSAGRPLLTSAVALSADGRRVLKLEFFPHFRKRNTLGREAAIIRRLNDAACVSAPRLADSGVLSHQDITEVFPAEMLQRLEAQGRVTYEYFILDFASSGRHAPLADILLAMLEQKQLGVYQGDVKPANIRFDDRRGICILIDYDQAEELPEAVRTMNAADFLDWCDVRERERYSDRFDTWRRHFKGLRHWRHVAPLLRDGAFDVAMTTPVRHAGNDEKRACYGIASRIVYLDGTLDCARWTALMDAVQFTADERVLDVGCNSGGLCDYLVTRGCRPTGMDTDDSMLAVAKMTANILDNTIDFISSGVDLGEIPPAFDTACLLPAGYAAWTTSERVRRASESCGRLLVGCRLIEPGPPPVRRWLRPVDKSITPAWDFPNETAATSQLPGIFPGFRVARTVRDATGERLLADLTRKSA